MNFDDWYEKTIKRGQVWDFNHKETEPYRMLKKAYLAGLKKGVRIGVPNRKPT